MYSNIEEVLFKLYSNIFPSKKHHDHLPNYIKISTNFKGSKYINQLTIEEIVTEEFGFYSCHYNKIFNNKVVKE